MTEQANPKNWWESNLEWTLTASMQEKLQAGHRFIRGIPDTINAHHLEQPSHVDDIEPDPVEKIAKTTKPIPRAPRVIPPPPKPPCLERKALPPLNVRGVNMPAVFSKSNEEQKEEEEPVVQVEEKKAPERKITLEQLLDPDFCGYTS